MVRTPFHLSEGETLEQASLFLDGPLG